MAHLHRTDKASSRHWAGLGITTIWLLAVAAGSCNYGPAPVTQPGISPSSAGRLAIEMYDTNADGVIAGEELEEAPSLKGALPRLDTNGDHGVSAKEVAARVDEWKEMEAGLMSFSYRVILDGSPLTNAVVTFEPEAYLGDEIKGAVGPTNDYGSGAATIPKEQRPSAATPPGMHIGLYKVKISKIVGGKETVPRRYNEATILGQEVAYDVPEIANNRVVYTLTAK